MTGPDTARRIKNIEEEEEADTIQTGVMQMRDGPSPKPQGLIWIPFEYNELTWDQ